MAQPLPKGMASAARSMAERFLRDMVVLPSKGSGGAAALAPDRRADRLSVPLVRVVSDRGDAESTGGFAAPARTSAETGGGKVRGGVRKSKGGRARAGRRAAVEPRESPRPRRARPRRRGRTPRPGLRRAGRATARANRTIGGGAEGWRRTAARGSRHDLRPEPSRGRRLPFRRKPGPRRTCRNIRARRNARGRRHGRARRNPGTGSARRRRPRSTRAPHPCRPPARRNRGGKAPRRRARRRGGGGRAWGGLASWAMPRVRGERGERGEERLGGEGRGPPPSTFEPD